jgi:uridine kinase
MFKTLLFFFCISLSSLFATPILIGIAGGTGSGKTTLADKIRKAFPKDSILISQDFYYKDLSHLSFEERAKTNFDHPSSLDFALLREHLIELKQGRSIHCPIYSFHTHSRESGYQLVEPAHLIIVEGILLLAVPEIRELFDLKIFVDTDDDIRLLRRIERDIKERSRDFDSVKRQYIMTVKPMHDAFVMPSKQYADVIVPEGGYNKIALSLILAKLDADLKLFREHLKFQQ